VAKKKTVTAKPAKAKRPAAMALRLLPLFGLGAGSLEIRRFTNTAGAPADPDNLPPHFVVQGHLKGQLIGGSTCALLLSVFTAALQGAFAGNVGGPVGAVPGATQYSVDVDLTGLFPPGSGPQSFLLRVEYNVAGPASSCLPQETDITVVF
jgi:hypothetical protein